MAMVQYMQGLGKAAHCDAVAVDAATVDAGSHTAAPYDGFAPPVTAGVVATLAVVVVALPVAVPPLIKLPQLEEHWVLDKQKWLVVAAVTLRMETDTIPQVNTLDYFARQG